MQLGESITARGNSVCRGPAVSMVLASERSSRSAVVTGARWEHRVSILA